MSGTEYPFHVVLINQGHATGLYGKQDFLYKMMAVIQGFKLQFHFTLLHFSMKAYVDCQCL